jgi:peptidoglycan/LPS O-acetylase OafA/YrhL
MTSTVGATTPLGLEAPAGNPRFPMFDALRGLAAASVFAYHANHAQSFPGPLQDLAAHANMGVVLFFLISGFLLYRPFITAREGAAPEISTGRFYQRRLLRVVPAYWVAVACLAIYPGLPLFAEGWPQFLTFTQIYDPSVTFGGIGAAWSLCIELSFYALLPLYAFVVARVRLSAERELLILAALAVLAVGFHVVIGRDAQNANLNYTLPGTFYLFAVGMALAVAHVKWPGRRAFALAERAGPYLWVLALVLFVGVSETTSGEALGSVHPIYTPIALLILLPAIAMRPVGMTRVLMHPALVWFGTVSYAFYLWHQGVLRMLAPVTDSPFALAALAAGTTAIIAALSYRLVEAPFLRRKRGLSTAASSPAAIAPNSLAPGPT